MSDEKKVEKIVITGGPCAGKSTALSRIQTELSQLGYKVFFVSECATELIKNGITPWEFKNFQNYVMKYQIAQEAIYEKAAAETEGKTIIICDRGALDNKAYMSEEDFENLLRECNTNEVELRDSYSAVFHLVTAAKGAEEFYTTVNNSARTETPEQAVEADRKTREAWTGHEHFRTIDNSTDFDGKIRRLIVAITSHLGEPEPFEIERKFLIEYPDIEWLESLPNCQKVEIIQTYLRSDNGDEVRVRQRGLDGHYTYTKTIKRRVSDIKRLEIEKRLSKDEYLVHLMQADTTKHQVRKTRYCISYKNSYLELDVYPFWTDKAILEIELEHEDDEFSVPDEIKIIKEVTDDATYKNVNIASL